MRDLKGMNAAAGPTRWLPLKLKITGAVFLLALAAVFLRTVRLQLFESAKLTSLAQEQYVREREVMPRRGDMFDRNALPLAQSVEVDSIWVDPSLLEDVATSVRLLAKATNQDRGELLAKIRKGKRFVWVKRHATPEEVVKARALSLSGVGFTPEPKRFYPQRELAAQLLGVVDSDGKGRDGLELAYDDELTGDVVRAVGVRDAKGRMALTEGTAGGNAERGARVTLTIDRTVQYTAEQVLAKAVSEAQAIAGQVVVLDVQTGEVLALAHAPTANPNLAKDRSSAAMRNRAVVDAFEPGSTIKPFLVAAALEAGSVQSTTSFDCERGAWRVGRHTINDSHPHGVLNVRQIVQVSSNIGMGKIAQRLGKTRAYEALKNFGFGESIDLGLPGAARGQVPFPKAEVSLVTQSFGQGMTASLLQIAAAYGALGNGGVLMKPYVVARVEGADGTLLAEGRPSPVRQAVSKGVARTVVSMLEEVVKPEGTAPKARLDEYRVAGKTGTAQKPDLVHGGYSDKRIASFVGLVPADHPRVVIAVTVDEPVGDTYGGLVAAPVFREIAATILPHLGVVPLQAKVMALPTVVEQGPTNHLDGDNGVELAGPGEPGEGGDTVAVPDVVGAPARRAVTRVLGYALLPRVKGSGSVVAQRPAAGTKVARGAFVDLVLSGPGAGSGGHPDG